MLFALQLLAQAADGGQAQPSPTGGLWSFAPLIIIFILFYFFMIRAPMKRQEQERKNLYSALKKNDKVVTSAGIIGIVASIKENEDEVTLKVDESSNVRLRVLKSSIQRILSGDETPKDDAKAS
ncbi:MAG TPA: preprotein translocase subunit YajC [Gemmataceae bacterium]|jgi:preprotein translocase subunit YajC|nr:preprotein translocase subunit YajC [Gemmataceae bacterium]